MVEGGGKIRFPGPKMPLRRLIASKPGELTLGILPGAQLDLVGGRLERGAGAQGSGHLPNTPSNGGLFPPPYQTLYCTAKYGVVGLSETLRHEMLPRGIAVSVVCPGAVASEIFHKGGQKTPAHAISPEQAAIETLEGVARKEGIIVVGDDARHRYDLLLHDSEGAEQYQKAYSQKRYETFVLRVKHDW